MNNSLPKVDLSTFNNDWYGPQIGASRLKQLFWYFTNIFCFINPFFIFGSLKIIILRAFGASIGSGVVIKPSVNIKYPWKLKIGDHSWIGENVWIDNLAEVTLGQHVCLSQGAMLLTGNHNYKKTGFDLVIGKIVLQNGVWIGAKSIVAPGVICHTHAVLAVQSVANKNLEPYTIYQGNPALPQKKRVINQTVNKFQMKKNEKNLNHHRMLE